MPKRAPRVVEELPIPKDLEGSVSPMRSAFTTDLGTLWRADAEELLGSLETGSVDLIVADPPYAIGKDQWDRFASMESYLAWCDRWLVEVSRILRPSGSAYICGFSEILADIKVRGVGHFGGGCRWLIWYYRNKANLGNDWGRSHESILHLRKENFSKLNIDPVRVPYNNHTERYPARVQSISSQYGGGKRRDRWTPHPLGAKPRDVFEIPVLCNGVAERTYHPTQKPEELIRRFIAATTETGALVVDPFAGSGTTAVVAQRLQRKWIVGDADARYVGLARQRLGEQLK